MSNFVEKHGVLIEESPKGKWRVVTRACNSGRVLKIWFDKVDLRTAKQLASGVKQGAKRRLGGVS